MSRFEFKLPDIGEGVVEGEIVKWLVKAGDPVAEDQGIVEVMTDKATVTIPTPRAGKVLETRGKEGEIAKVHDVIVVIETEGGAAEVPAAANATPASQPAAAPQAMAASAGNAALAGDGRRVLATPVTRRIAREHGVDLGRVAGTGPQGRVTKNDVLGFVNGGSGATALGPQTAVKPIAPVQGDQRIPIRGLRKRIAENLVRSKQSAPHYHFVEELDVSKLVAVREQVNARLATKGEKISFLPFLVKAVIAGLRRNPRCNAVMDEQAQELVLRGEYNIGVAVATEEGLVVPVVHHADRLTMREIAAEIVRLSDAARARKLTQKDIQGGTFTITSLGTQGGLFATPIINHPEVAIMGVHRMRRRPAFDDAGNVVARDMMYLSWAFDHRNVDGAEGARFAYDVIEFVQNPEALLVEMT